MLRTCSRCGSEFDGEEHAYRCPHCRRDPHRSDPKLGDILTPREAQVLSELTRVGASNKEIAHTLHLAEGTIKLYLYDIYRKIGVKRRTQAVMWWRDRHPKK